MSGKILCAVYLLIAISSVHSASFYYRAGREVIIPEVPLDEVKEVLSELKNDQVVVEEVIIPAVEVEKVPEPVVESVASDEGRAKQGQVLRLDTMEIVPNAGENSEKVQTVAEAVKSVAVQEIEKRIVEALAEIPAEVVPPVIIPAEVVKADLPKEEVPVVDSVVAVETPIVKSVPLVEPEVKVPEPVVAVVKEESIVPVVEAEPVKESVRSAEPEPVKLEEPVKEEKIETPKPVEKIVEAVVEPVVRQQAGSPSNPLEQFQTVISNGFNTLTSGLQNTVTNLLSNTPFGNRPQSDVTADSESEALNTAEVAPVPTTAAAAIVADEGSTSAPNLIQSVQQAITQITNNIIPAQFRPTTAPVVAEAPAVVSGTRVGENTVEEHHVDVVNDKIDLTKKAE